MLIINVLLLDNIYIPLFINELHLFAFLKKGERAGKKIKISWKGKVIRGE